MAMKIVAKKSLGQNFLHSPKAIKAMVSAPQLTHHDRVVEIGPGKGALTQPLLETGAEVHAIELDQRMIEYLSETFALFKKQGKFVLHYGDVLTIDIGQLLKYQSYSVVANIPYYITNAIIRFFLSSDHQPTMMCLLIQHEVAERIVARDGKESLLSLSVRAYGTPKYVMKVPRTAFNPRPRVDSAIITISNISRTLFDSLEHEEHFFKLIKMAFAQKRKQAIKNLSPLYDKETLLGLLADYHYVPTVRAEDISCEHWIDIARKTLTYK